MIDPFIAAALVAMVFIVGLNLFIYRKKVSERLDVNALKSTLSISVIFSIIVLMLIYLNEYSITEYWSLIFFGFWVGGTVGTLYGIGVRQRWFLLFWGGIIISGLCIIFFGIDLGKYSGYGIIMLCLAWLTLHLYNKEKNYFY